MPHNFTHTTDIYCHQSEKKSTYRLLSEVVGERWRSPGSVDWTRGKGWKVTFASGGCAQARDDGRATADVPSCRSTCHRLMGCHWAGNSSLFKEKSQSSHRRRYTVTFDSCQSNSYSNSTVAALESKRSNVPSRQFFRQKKPIVFPLEMCRARKSGFMWEPSNSRSPDSLNWAAGYYMLQV
jgi:hypothetical protein